MRFRKLRIAWSVTWSLAAVMLIALWGRSYWQLDFICKCDSKSIMTTIGSQWGLIYFAHFDAYLAYNGTGNSYATHDWEYRTHESYALDRRLWESDSKGFLVNLP